MRWHASGVYEPAERAPQDNPLLVAAFGEQVNPRDARDEGRNSDERCELDGRKAVCAVAARRLPASGAGLVGSAPTVSVPFSYDTS